jgi:hypothetical protein
VSTGAVVALIGLGAFHGLNPGMGWLFAVAIGLQERSRTAVLRSLGPIAVGHAASVLAVALVVSAVRSVAAGRVVAIAGGAVLVGFGLWRTLSQRHFRWAGMRLSSAQLAGWSFLVSSAHGAGLMLLPVLATGPLPAGGHTHAALQGTPGAALGGLAAAGVHTLAMLLTMLTCAVIVYEFVGVAVLRRAWFNVDRLWAAVMVGTGALTIALTA